VHGALCVAISGKCYMSLATYNSSANRGACLQNCRRSYKLVDEETGDELVLDNKYIMSPKDLCTIGFIDKIIEAGVKVMKIEGRGRAPDYVDTVVTAYREAIQSYGDGSYNQEKIDNWILQLEKVFNRGFWHGGYYLGKQLGEWSGTSGSQATEEKTYIGRVLNYFKDAKIGYFHLETGAVKIGDEILITGPTTGVVRTKVENIVKEAIKIDSAVKGDMITIPVGELVREADKLFVICPK
jgi:putative protease